MQALSLPEWIPQLTWLVLVTGAAAWCGHRDPALGWKAGAIVIAVQPLAILVILLVTGELLHPSSSTSGLVAVFILTVFAVVLSPIPILAGVVASRRRARKDAPRTTPVLS